MLLGCATAIAILSLFLPEVFLAMPFILHFVAYPIPLVLGGLTMLLCLMARQRTRHKRLVVAYAVFLAPFAFSWPAWMAYIAVLYFSGKYTGPMP
jgi:dolichol kinase